MKVFVYPRVDSSAASTFEMNRRLQRGEGKTFQETAHPLQALIRRRQTASLFEDEDDEDEKEEDEDGDETTVRRVPQPHTHTQQPGR